MKYQVEELKIESTWFYVAPLETEGQAQHFLSELGIECYNGGSDVNYYKSYNKIT
jgi:hypothetical protein